MSAISLSAAPLFLNPPILPITWYCFEKPSCFIIIPTFSSISSLSWIPLMTTMSFLFSISNASVISCFSGTGSSLPLLLQPWPYPCDQTTFLLIPPSIPSFPGSSSPSISPSHPSVSPDPFPAAATFHLPSPQFLHNWHNTILWHCLTFQPSQLPQTFAEPCTDLPLHPHILCGTNNGTSHTPIQPHSPLPPFCTANTPPIQQARHGHHLR